ncbi:hypothetical protein JTB14_030786 [Gonioctena quinquepunctata]|nr:hypothetical protein JTB14_030786 [Gonioctena quinquepunctata]
MENEDFQQDDTTNRNKSKWIEVGKGKERNRSSSKKGEGEDKSSKPSNFSKKGEGEDKSGRFRAGNPKIWMYVYKVKQDVNEDDIQNYLKVKTAK